MSNILDYVLDVLATSPEEINRIAIRLRQPSPELLDWVTKRDNCKPEEISQSLTHLVSFKPVRNLFYIHESVNKARRFENSFKDKFTGIITSHIFEISAEFPNAVFFLEYYDPQHSYSGKSVVRAGKAVQGLLDDNHQSQAVDWVLLDIFAPFRAEWNEGLPFGCLWAKWVEDATKQLEKLGRVSTKKLLAQRPNPEVPKELLAARRVRETQRSKSYPPFGVGADANPGKSKIGKKKR